MSSQHAADAYDAALPDSRNPAAVALGRLGGKKGVKNPRKAHAVTSEQARAAVNARWAKHRTTQS